MRFSLDSRLRGNDDVRGVNRVMGNHTSSLVIPA